MGVTINIGVLACLILANYFWLKRIQSNHYLSFVRSCHERILKRFDLCMYEMNDDIAKRADFKVKVNKLYYYEPGVLVIEKENGLLIRYVKLCDKDVGRITISINDELVSQMLSMNNISIEDDISCKMLRKINRDVCKLIDEYEKRDIRKQSEKENDEKEAERNRSKVLRQYLES